MSSPFLARTLALVLAPLALACAGRSGESRNPDAGSGGTDAGPGPVDSGPGPTDAGADLTDGGALDTGSMTGTDAGGAGSGACTNAADTAILETIDVEMVTGSCAEGCFGGGDCTRDCLIEMTMISMPCAQCFGDVVACTAMMCTFECLGGGDSPECMACRDSRGCSAAFATCSGLS
jgi:hypothetical protein